VEDEKRGSALNYLINWNIKRRKRMRPQSEFDKWFNISMIILLIGVFILLYGLLIDSTNVLVGGGFILILGVISSIINEATAN
jgi:hypothetical protein